MHFGSGSDRVDLGFLKFARAEVRGVSSGITFDANGSTNTLVFIDVTVDGQYVPADDMAILCSTVFLRANIRTLATG